MGILIFGIGFCLAVGLICPLAGVVAWLAAGRPVGLREWMRRV